VRKDAVRRTIVQKLITRDAHRYGSRVALVDISRRKRSIIATNAHDGVAGPEQPISDAPEPQPETPAEASKTETPASAYADFAAALKGAMRDFHCLDLLTQNPLLRHGIGGLGASAGPTELRALLAETTSKLFANPRDEMLRRVIELTYFHPAPKQEAVADRLSLAFGTYRRYLTTARNRLARWLWESVRTAAAPTKLPSAAGATAKDEGPRGEPAISPTDSETAAPRLSLVVLPFVNIGGGAEQDHFVDGITETLTTDLSRSSGVFAISRNTAFAYKGKPIDTRQIGRELGVRYALEGSVQSAGDWIRINAQLVGTVTGAHLWADRLDAVDHTLQGWAAWNERLSLDAAHRARRCFEAALRLDEHHVGALVGLANAHMWEVNMYGSDDRPGQICAAEVAATKALALAPDSADAHVAYGTVLYGMRTPEKALREFEFAVGLDANLAVAHGYLGLMTFFLGRAQEIRGHVAEAMRLSPRDPLLFRWHFFIGVADVYLGRVVHGLESLRKSVEINPHCALSQFVLAGALALAGLSADADEVCAIARRLAPNFTIAKFRAEAVSDSPVYLAQRELFYEGLRLAGVPES
jgi:TolB-like protein